MSQNKQSLCEQCEIFLTTFGFVKHPTIDRMWTLRVRVGNLYRTVGVDIAELEWVGEDLFKRVVLTKVNMAMQTLRDALPDLIKDMK